MNYEQLVLSSPAYLSGACLSGATRLCIQSGVVWPINLSGSFRVVIDQEIKRLQGGSGFIWNIIQNGAEGTTQQNHNDGAAVSHILTPQAIKNLTGSINPQTTAYTVSVADRASLLTVNSATPITITIPQSTSGDTDSFGPHFYTTVLNLGVGTVTLSPQTSLINSLASINLTTNQAATVYADGTNYN